MPPDSLLVPKRWRLILSAAFLLLALGLGVAFILFKRRHHAATDRERARIARDLHDDLGARLTRLSLLMDNATNDRLRPEDAAKQRSLVAVTAREILESMDGVIWAETPESDTLESLITFIIQYSTTFLAATPIRILLDTPSASPALKIGPQMKKNIFLVVKEALSNIVKHSGATEAKLAIQCVDSRLTITIVDNGRGLPAPANETNPSSRPASAARKGNGLTNMKIRMEEIGGSVSISPGPEHGAAVSLTVAL